MTIVTAIRFLLPAVLVIFTASAYPALAGPRMFIPLGSENRIIVIDASTDEVIGSIEDVSAVHGLAGTPDGEFLIAGSYDEWEKGTAPVEKPEGISEVDHAAHHGGAKPSDSSENNAISTVSVLRVTDGKAVRRIEVPGAVHHVAISSDGRFAAITHPNADAVSLIDLATHTVSYSLETGSLPNYAVFSPNSKIVYVSNAGNGSVSAVDMTSRKIIWHTFVGNSPEHIVLSPDGSRLYVNNVDDGTVSVIATSDGDEIEHITVGETPHGIDLSDDGATLFVAALGDGKLVAVDLSTNDKRTVQLSPEPYHLATVRGLGKVYVSSADAPKIWVIDQGTLDIVGEIMIGGKGHQMVQGAGN